LRGKNIDCMVCAFDGTLCREGRLGSG